VTDLDADGSAISTRFELTFERAHEIADFFVINVEVTISRYAKLVTLRC
jgi:hypothetical protein